MSNRSGWSRRQVLGTAALAAAPVAAQQQQHQHASQASAAQPVRPAAGRAPQFFTEAEFATLKMLCDLILPADDISPAASATGAPEYIDLLCRNNSRLAQIYHGGLAWLDSTCRSLHGKPFREAAADQQNGLLEKLAYRERTPPDWKGGAQFFDWVRRMTIDAYYTSPAGYADIGYKGGHGMTAFQVPEAALRQALDKLKI